MMAACDYVYGNRNQWKELHDFLKRYQPDWAERFMQIQPEMGDGICRICYVGSIQGWLLNNCHLKWIKKPLRECIYMQRMLNGKAHHE